MTIPWRHHPKTRKDLLVDILVEVPSLYEDVDRISLQTVETQQVYRQDIHARVSAVIERLEDWNSKFGVASSCAGQDWRFPASMPTDKIADTHIMTLYWACSLVVYGVHRQVTDESDIISVNPEDCCRSIIHCIPLFLHPSTGAFRQHLVPFPLMAAARYLISVQTPELQAERDYVQSLCENSGFAPIHQFISSLQPRILTSLKQ
jgi:hypothetical protein